VLTPATVRPFQAGDNKDPRNIHACFDYGIAGCED